MSANRSSNAIGPRLARAVGELLCRLGAHNYELKEQTFDFGGASVAKYQCKRCGRKMSRSS